MKTFTIITLFALSLIVTVPAMAQHCTTVCNQDGRICQTNCR
jgi:hypothetical protein